MLSMIAARIGIKGGIIAVLLLALGFMWWRAGVWQERAEDLTQAVANEKAAHAVTRVSLDQCADAHAAYIDDGIKRRRALERALERQESRSAALERQIAAIRAQRAPARTAEAVRGVCETADAVMRAEGL